MQRSTRFATQLPPNVAPAVDSDVVLPVHATLRKIYYFWWFYPLAGDYYPAQYLQIYKWTYAVGAVLGLAGLFVSLRDFPQARSGILLLVVLSGVVSVSQGLFYVNIRHRWGIEALAGILTALGIVRFGGLGGTRLARSVFRREDGRCGQSV